jgi:GNAT superfamily N-acetyltransferase
MPRRGVHYARPAGAVIRQTCIDDASRGHHIIMHMVTDFSIAYQCEPELSVEEFIDVLVRSTLAERRPVADLEVMRGMLRYADLVVTARAGTLLVGVSRAITDFSYCTYLSDLAVDRHYQRKGIGRELIRHTHAAAGLHTMLILLAAPAAESYYPHIGMNKHTSCWTVPRQPRPDR